MKKTVSLLLMLAMLFSAFSAAAFYKAPELSPTGVVVNDDFEGYNAGTNPTTFKNGGLYQRQPGVVEETDGNKYYTFPGKNNALLLTLEDLYGAGAKIETGKLKIQYDVKLPKPEKKLEVVDGEAQGQYLYLVNYGADGGWSKDDASNRAYFSSIRIHTSDDSEVDNVPYIAFNDTTINGGMATLNGDKGNARFIDFDRWYTVTSVVDYDAKKVDHYVDGEKVTSYKGAATAAMVRSYSASWLQFCLKGENTTGKSFQLDNFIVERLGGGTITASYAGSGDDYVDIKFDKTLEKDLTIDPSAFSLKMLGSDEELVPTDYEYVSANTIRLSFAQPIEPGTNYELQIDAELYEVGNDLVTLPKGTRIFFATDAVKESYTLVDQNFEDTTFPETAEDGENFADFTYFGKASEKGAEFERAGSLTSKYIKKNTDKFADTDGKGNVMQVFHSDAYPVVDGVGTAHKSVLFPFAEGREVSSGKVTSEFDLYFCGDEIVWKTQFGFGLHDANRTEAAFGQRGAWTDATLFMGLTDWSHYTTKVLVPALKEDRAFIRGWYDVTTGGAAQGWQDSYYKKLFGYHESTPQYLAKWHNFKFVVDLDAGNFEVFMDGASYGVYDYIPGDADNASYDGLVITTVDDGAIGDPTAFDGRGGKLREAAGTPVYPNCYYLDNVKVTYDAPQPIVVRNAEFKEIDGSYAGFSSVMPAGTKQAIFTLSQDADAESAQSFVELAGENDGYTVSANGKDIVVDFTNCLKPQTEYELTLKQGLKSANGVALAKDVVFKFMTDEGGIKFLSPVIMKGSTPLTSASQIAEGDLVTATVTVVNTTSDGKGAYVVLLAYKDGYLTAVAHEQYVPTVDRMYSEDISVNITAEGGFVGADSVKAIAFDTLSGVHPLCDATEVLK